MNRIWPVSYTHLDVYKRQVISSNKYTLQRALHEFQKTIEKCNLILSVEKSEVIAFCGAFPTKKNKNSA